MWNFLTHASLFNSSPTMKVLHELLVATLQATLVLGIAYALTLLMRRASAAQRQWVWLLALSGMLVLPLASNALPDRIVLVSSRLAPQVETLHLRSGTFASANSAFQSSSTDTEVAPAPMIATISLEDIMTRVRNAWPMGILCCWLTGVLAFALRLGISLRNMRRLERASALVQDGLWAEQVHEAEQKLQIKRRVTVLIAQTESSPLVPLTWGWRRPVVLLPGAAEAWSPEKRRMVLREWLRMPRCLRRG